MNCDIIKDLIPLCSEGLCSEESEKEIQEHIKGCESCRLLYENIPETGEKLPEIPEKSNAFRKVNKKIKRHRILDIFLLLLTAAILSGLGYLTYGQITKKPGCKSFETIFQSIEVRKIADYIAEGDAESFLESMYTEYESQIYTVGHAEKIRQKDIEAFNELYDEVIAGRAIKDISVSSHYFEYDLIDGVYSQVCSIINIVFESGPDFSMELVKEADGRYTNGYVGISLIHADEYTAEEEAMMNFENVLAFAGTHDIISPSVSGGFFKHHLTREAANEEQRCESIALRFTPDCREAVENNALSFYENGFTISNVIISESKFDAERNFLYYEMCITGSDESGSAVMHTRLYFDYTGLYSPESDDTVIFSNGCTPELEDALADFFG